MTQTIIKPKRSVKLSPDEFEQIKKEVAEKGIMEVSFDLRIGRDTLERVLVFGSGAEKTINKIREKFEK